MAGETTDSTPYFGTSEGAVVSGDFIAQDTTDLKHVSVKADVSEGFKTHLAHPYSTTPTIYNTAGQRLITPQRGINIIDQKKVMVK